MTRPIDDDPNPLCEDYPGQRITGPDFDTRDREGATDPADVAAEHTMNDVLDASVPALRILELLHGIAAALDTLADDNDADPSEGLTSHDVESLDLHVARAIAVLDTMRARLARCLRHP